jgi:hypothetical protein
MSTFVGDSPYVRARLHIEVPCGPITCFAVNHTSLSNLVATPHKVGSYDEYRRIPWYWILYQGTGASTGEKMQKNTNLHETFARLDNLSKSGVMR